MQRSDPKYSRNPDIPKIIEAVMIAVDGEDPISIQIALQCVLNSVQAGQVQAAMVQRGPGD